MDCDVIQGNFPTLNKTFWNEYSSLQCPINSVHAELVHELIMAESETGFSDLMDDLDLDKTHETGYEEDIEVEIINGFYHQNVAFINERIQIFTDYWMKLYSNCCLQ